MKEEPNVEFLQIVEQSELPPGERLFVEVEGVPIVLFNVGGRILRHWGCVHSRRWTPWGGGTGRLLHSMPSSWC